MTRQVGDRGNAHPKFGRVINISLGQRKKGRQATGQYSAAKAATSVSPKALRWPGNRQNRHHREVILPGLYNTGDGAGGAEGSAGRKKRYSTYDSLNRLGEREDDRARRGFPRRRRGGIITGSTLTLNGGQYQEDLPWSFRGHRAQRANPE